MPSVPLVLCFHSVSASWPSVLAVTLDELERHLVALLRRGYEPATMGDLLTRRGKLLHATFDDAFAGAMDAAGVLERLGLPGTVFACSAHAESGQQSLEVPELASDRREYPSEFQTLGWEDLRALADKRIEIGSHCVTHAHLTLLDDEHLYEQLESSRLRVEDELGRPCRFLAYPFGESDERVREAARKAGYEAAFGLPGNRSWSDSFDLPRVGVWRGERPVRVRLKASQLGPIVTSAKSFVGAFRRS
jgi:peptidoglycan/xylan/chitin deacetylase (PgdA/CDA1 family)